MYKRQVVGLVDDQDHGWTRYVGDEAGSAVSILGGSSERRTLISPAEIDEVMGIPLW